MARARPGKFRGAIPKSSGAASKSMKIKDQGTVPLAQPKQQANGGPPSPAWARAIPEAVAQLYAAPNLKEYSNVPDATTKISI